MKEFLKMLVVGAALLSLPSIATAANQYGTPKSIVHVVTILWKADSTPEQQQAAIDGVKKMAADLNGGDDTLIVMDFEFKKKVDIDLGKGSDDLILDGIRAKKLVEVTGGGGADSITPPSTASCCASHRRRWRPCTTNSASRRRTPMRARLCYSERQADWDC